MRNWCSRHPVWFMALYALFYLSFFALLERTIQTPDLWVHCQLDDLIPFCKYAIVPYILWFPWIPFTLFYLLYKAPREDFWRLCIPLFTGMTMTLLFYAIVPNGLALRPKYVPGTDIFAQLVRMIYRSDTPMNVCPSIHVFNSVTLMLAYKGVPLNVGPVLEATGYIYVTIFGVTIFHEKMNPKKLAALAMILVGILVYAL